jgi:hypothetical protein
VKVAEVWLHLIGVVSVDNKEIYKDIPNYEGLYMISNKGNVKSLPKGDGNGARVRILKSDLHGNSVKYLRVTLSKNGVTKRISIHRMVATVFIPNPDNKPCVNHIDNNGMNNNVNNLEWCTPKENMSHAAKQGRMDKAREAATKSASKNRKKDAEDKGKALMGSRFLSVKTKKGYNFISFICLCGSEFERRSSSVVVNRGGICRKCNQASSPKIKTSKRGFAAGNGH